MKFFICLALFIAPVLLINISTSAMAMDYFVSPQGNDRNNCLAGNPCREIRRTLSLLQPGDRVFVADGQYLGFTASNIVGTAQSPITIQAQGQNVEILPTTDRGTFGDRDNIYLTFCQHIIIDGLRTFNAPRAGLRLDVSHFITVRNGVFGNNRTWGIFTNHSNNPLIENNKTFGSIEQHGIYFSNSADNPIIRGNISYDNRANGIHINGDLSSGSHGDVVGDGIVTGAIIENNIIYNNGIGGGAGINMDGVQDSIVRNNIIYNQHATGIALFRENGAEGPRNVAVYNNTIDIASNGRWAILIWKSDGPIILRNNILYNRHHYRGGMNYLTISDVNNTDSDYNVFGGNVSITPNDNNIVSFRNWQAQGYEPHSFTAVLDDLFVSPSSGDYHLLSTSSTKNSGISLKDVPTDFEGNYRPQDSRFDIGADEVKDMSFPGKNLSLPQSNFRIK